MSDLRDFTPRIDDAGPRFIEQPVIVTESFPEATFVDSGGLGEMHINNDIVEESGSRRSKWIAGAAVAVVFGAVGVYAITTFMANQPKVADDNLPSPSAPVSTAAMTPPPPVTPPEATTPAENMRAPTAPDMVKPAPVTKQARATAPKVEALPKSDVTQQAAPVSPPVAAAPLVTPAPVENQAANVPEPVSPTPPANTVAGNPALNEQSAAPETPAPAEAPTPAPAPAEQPAETQQ